MVQNEMVVRFRAISQNEGFARITAGAFATQLNPTIGELSDIKTAVSEAVTNAIVHGYGTGNGMVEMRAFIIGNELTIEISDEGKGIADIEQARLPFFTTCPEQDRSGMGFTVMETFMDSLEVESKLGKGTRVCMKKRIGIAMDSLNEVFSKAEMGQKLKAYPINEKELEEFPSEDFSAEEDELDNLVHGGKNGGRI